MSHNSQITGSSQSGLGDIDLIDVVVGVWKRKFIVALFAIIGIGLAFAYITFTKPNYTSEVRILIDRTDSDLTRLVEPAPDAATQLQFDREAVESQVQILFSRDLAIEVANELNLHDKADFRSGGILSMFGLGSREASEERVLKAFFDRLTVYQVRDSRVIGVIFRSSDPVLAADVANKLVEVYLRAQSDAKTSSTERAGEWLRDQIELLRSQLADTEAKVQAFRARHGIFNSRDNQSLDSQQLAELNSELIRARASRSETQARARLLREMVRSGENIETAVDVVQSPLMQRLVEQRVTLRARISELSSTLGPRHPRLLELQAELSNLTGQMQAEALKIAQSLENEARVAGAREEALLDSLEDQKTVTSLSEEQQIELRALEREAATQRQLLEVYLTRFGEAISRQNPEFSTANARVISKARPSQEPSSPKKAASLFIGAFAGFLLGFVVAMTLAILSTQKEAYARYKAAPKPSNEPQASFAGEGDVPTPFQPAYMTGYSSVSGVPAMSQRIKRQVETFGFARLMIIYSGDESLLPRQLARGLSHLGQSVILVETGRGPTAPGLSEALAGQMELANVIERDRVSGAHIIPGGVSGFVPQYAERLESALIALQKAYPCLLISCPREAVSPGLLRMAPEVLLAHEPDERLRQHLSVAEAVTVFNHQRNDLAPDLPQGTSRSA